jgi:putative membrane protein
LKSREPVLLLIIAVLFLGMSSIHPYDRMTWLLEIFPILIAIALLTATFRRFPLTPLLYRLIFLHSLILIIGGYYTYARVPIGVWVQPLFDFSRNHFDRLGHFAQGFVPAVIAREILLRNTPLQKGKMLFFIVVSICLAFSAFYEFIEWWAALIMGQAADDFLGTQGDPWDTQWDMFMAFTGAIIAQLTLSRQHDRELEQHCYGAAEHDFAGTQG